ncbi:tRNA 2-thiouridine(34) synthase MnmA [Candidatus Dependentiae bacterium]|nr:tRNA 2-thiouridine(34) synthase MnmA [Candidatus Dependentiae bacterium]
MKIAVLVSGGVDSSVALKLLQDQGHDITAFYLKIWLEDELSFLGTCPWQEDLNYVQATCEKLGVKLEVVSLQKEYWDTIVSYVIKEVKAGRTPNPDILCNQHIKFGAFFSKIGPEFEKVATGHYAQVAEKDGLFYLKSSPDAIKDQTYFLSKLTKNQISRALFPIGEFNKPAVRELAQKFDLPTKSRKDSQGICFLGKLKYNDFIKHHVGELPGKLVEFETGKVLGQHKGYWFHTIGQRQGSGLSGGPWYVVKKDIASNTVFVSKQYYTENKVRDKFFIQDCNWIIDPIQFKDLKVKLRHGASMHNCTIQKISEDKFFVQLSENDQGIAPGQFAAFYKDDYCLGSGVIVD